MDLVATRKWEILRVLHENYKVPLPLLTEIGQVEIKTAIRIAGEQNWRLGICAAMLQARLASAFEDQLKRLDAQECDDAATEKQARALQVMAKTLESIAALENSELVRPSDIDSNKGSDEQLPMDEELLTRLNQDLEILVTKIEEDRRPD